MAGILNRSLASIQAPWRTKTAVGASIPTWQAGMPQYPQNPGANYERLARQGYNANELVYACVEELCSSASEPRLAAFRKGQPEPEKIDDHPALDLFEHPNPFLSRYKFIAGIILYRAVAGNAFVEIVRSGSGAPVELWHLRPDRVKVIPDKRDYIGGYEYWIGPDRYTLPARDVIHFRTNSLTDDFYGLPPLAPTMPRVDTDVWMRQYMASFFLNAGVPAGILNIKETLDDEDREVIRQQYRGSFGGAQGWHSLMLLDGQEATYQALGLSTGARGLAAPELDEITEARIPMVFGVPLELIGARLGMIHGNRSTTKEARGSFWDETLSPLYVEIADQLTLGLADEWPDVDYFGFDYSDVKALQEDEDAKHKRIVGDLESGAITLEEARDALGYPAKMKKSETLMLKSGITPMPVDVALAPPEPQPAQLNPGVNPNDPNAPPADPNANNPADFPELAGQGASSNGRSH